MGSQHNVPLEQASRYSFKAVSTEKSPGQRCSLAAAKTWTFFFFEEAAKRPTLFIRLRVPLMAPNRLSALLSPPATKKQRWVSLTRPCRRLAWDWSVFSWEAAKHPFQSFTVGVKILSMYRSSPFRSTLNTGYITCLGMCKVCTEAVHSVALCPAKKTQTPKHGPGEKDRNRARGVFQGRRTSRSAGIYIYIFIFMFTYYVAPSRHHKSPFGPLNQRLREQFHLWYHCQVDKQGPSNHVNCSW